MLDIKIGNNLVINVLMHILILFTFLYLFFFLSVSRNEEKVMKNQVNALAKDNIPGILKSIDDYDKDKRIKWDKIRKKSEAILSEPVDSKKDENNNNLKIIGGVVIFCLALLTGMMYLYYIDSSDRVDIKKILIENAVVFSFIGIIELIFYFNTASKYIPVYPNVIGDTVLTRVKEKINTL
jgi:Ca2+/Na+ antiporter